MNWTDNSFLYIVLGLMGISAIVSSLITISNGIKQIKQPILDLETKVEDYEKKHREVHMEHEKRISNLEGRMGSSESDRERLHRVNKLTLKALQALLSKDDEETNNVSKEIKEYMTEESA